MEVSMSRKIEFEEFMKILSELDESLMCSITIRAIGGFAMVLNSKIMNFNMPDRKSKDIDSLTVLWDDSKMVDLRHDQYGTPDLMQVSELNKQIDDLIWDIGVKYDCNDCDGWLNNSWYDAKIFKDELEEIIEWQQYTKTNWKNITLFYADLESLFVMKMRTTNEILTGKQPYYDGPRNNDVYDILIIMKLFKENDFMNIKNPKISALCQQYSEALKWFSTETKL